MAKESVEEDEVNYKVHLFKVATAPTEYNPLSRADQKGDRRNTSHILHSKF